jgi:hypothetical protein
MVVSRVDPKFTVPVHLPLHLSAARKKANGSRIPQDRWNVGKGCVWFSVARYGMSDFLTAAPSSEGPVRFPVYPPLKGMQAFGEKLLRLGTTPVFYGELRANYHVEPHSGEN